MAARRDADAKEPEEAFVKGMRTLLAAHPDEVEAQLDLALMIMRGFTLPEKKPSAPGSTEAVAILRGLLSKCPSIRGCTTTSFTVSKVPPSPRTPGRAVRNIRSWSPTFRTRSTCPVISTPRRDVGAMPKSPSPTPRGTSAFGWRRINSTATGITATMSTTWRPRTPSKAATTTPSRHRRSCFSSRRIPHRWPLPTA